MRDFTARASTSFAEGACCVTFLSTRASRSEERATKNRPTMTTTCVVYVQNHTTNNGHTNESGIPLGKKRGGQIASHFFLWVFCTPFFLLFKENHQHHQHHQPFFFREKEEPIVDRDTTSGGPTNHERSARTTTTTTNAAPFTPVFSFFFPKKTSRRSSTSLDDIY